MHHGNTSYDAINLCQGPTRSQEKWRIIQGGEEGIKEGIEVFVQERKEGPQDDMERLVDR